MRVAVGTQLQVEIDEQPEALTRLFQDGWSDVVQAVERIHEFRPEWVLIAARGTSDNAARYAQYLFGVHNKMGVALAAPSLFTLYGAAPQLGRALTIGISQSGQSPDVVSVLAAARRQGGATLAITNDPDSPLARAAHSCIRLVAGEERAVAATKTYTNELMALAMLSVAMGAREAHWNDLKRVPGQVAAALAGARDGLDEIAASFRADQRFLVVGRGFNYCTAHEIALKMKETSRVIAEPYSLADLLHGPVAMIDEGFPVIAVAPSGLGGDMAQLLDVIEPRRPRVIAISDRPEVLARAQVKIPLPPDVPEWLSPIVAVVPGQLFARALALAKGLDPDAPRGLAKVTLTH